MFKFLKQNKNIIMIATGLFIVSMSVLMFFLNSDPQAKINNHELKTSVIDSTSVKSNPEEERIYRDLVKNQDDPIVVIGLNGMVDFTSLDFASTTGYKKDEIKNQLFLSMIQSDDLGTFLKAFGKVIDTEEQLNLVGPYRFKNMAGEYRYYMSSLTPVMQNGKINKIAITLRDITDDLNKDTKATDPNTAEQDKKKYFGTPIGDKKGSDKSLNNKIANTNV